MLLSQLGELGLISFIEKACPSGGPGVIKGIGDDCAVYSTDHESLVGLVTTDLLIESVHFSEETMSWWDLGVKAVAVNVSDIAAMGGKPLFITVSLAGNGEMPVVDLQTLYRGITDTAHEYNVSVVGGDTSSSPGPLFLSISVIGVVERDRVLYRSLARPGDLVCVTGSLGGSHTGLKWLLSGLKDQDTATGPDCEFYNSIQFCKQKHQQPEARVSAGRFLSQSGSAHACIDMSDGLSRDLKHILTASGCGAVINLDSLPIDERTARVAGSLGMDPVQAAATGGEDYELLFTVPSEKWVVVEDGFRKLELPVTSIGSIKEGIDEIEYTRNGKPLDFNLSGYEHFK